MALGASAGASGYFVEDAVSQGVSPGDARALTALVRNSVEGRVGDRIEQDEWRSDFTLQPKLAKNGDAYVVSVERRKGNSILFTSQAKTIRMDDLSAAARLATNDAIDGASDSASSGSGSGAGMASAGSWACSRLPKRQPKQCPRQSPKQRTRQ